MPEECLAGELHAAPSDPIMHVFGCSLQTAAGDCSKMPQSRRVPIALVPHTRESDAVCGLALSRPRH